MSMSSCVWHPVWNAKLTKRNISECYYDDVTVAANFAPCPSAFFDGGTAWKSAKKNAGRTMRPRLFDARASYS